MRAPFFPVIPAYPGRKGSFVRAIDPRLSKMLRDGRVAGQVKLRRGGV